MVAITGAPNLQISGRELRLAYGAVAARLVDRELAHARPSRSNLT